MRAAKWTQEEDNRLIALISENSGNLENAFRLFAEESSIRTLPATRFRWYGVLRRRNDVKVCMVTIDRKHRYFNKKVIYNTHFTEKLNRGIWRKFLNLIFN